MAMVITTKFSWKYIFLCELLTNLLFNSSYLGVTDLQVSLTMPFNVYNEEHRI